MKIVKKLLRVFTLMLMMIMLCSISVFATGEGVTDATHGNTDLGGGSNRDGFLPTKTGYIVYCSDASGHATSPIIAFTWDGKAPYSTTGSPIQSILKTRFGEPAVFDDTLKAPWDMPAFSGGSGNGTAIGAWLKETPYGGCERGADYIMGKYLGMSDAQITEWYADANNRLNVEAIMFGGVYSGGSASSFTGMVAFCNVPTWAELVDENNWGSSYTHMNAPNSLEHEYTLFSQFPAPSARTGKHSSATITSEAYGIISFTPITGKQKVTVYKTNGVVDNTTYGFTSNPAEIKDEGNYKVTKWSTSKNKTKATSNKADFPEVCAGCELKRNGSSPTTIELTAEESAVFVFMS